MDTEIKSLPVNLNALAHQFPDSHKIHAYEYVAATEQLFVQFKSNANKVTYEYPGFKPERAAALDAAESKGKFFNKDFVTEFPDFIKHPGTDQVVVWPDRKAAEA